MAGEFTIGVDTPNSLVRMKLAGFFAPEDVVRLAAALGEAQRNLRCDPNAHVTLVDIRAMDIQSQQSVAEFQRILADPRTAARRIAFVVARSLARMQAKRAADGRGAAYFEHIDTAERWLLSPEDRSAVALGSQVTSRTSIGSAAAR